MTARTARSDRGATLIIAAAFCVVALIFAAFVIDIGNQRQNRRQLTSATDSPALAVAGEWASSGLDPAFDCDDTGIDETLSRANNPVGNPNPTYTCTFDEVTAFRSGVVTVAAREGVDFAFGGVTGVDSSSTGSLTSVRVQPLIGGGLRPIALCTRDVFPLPDRRPQDNGWTQSSVNSSVWFPSSTSVVPPLVLTNTAGSSTEACDTTGNWNQVLFRQNNTCPGQSNAQDGSQEFRDQYQNGTPYDVAVNDCVSRAPGNGGLSSSELATIVNKVVAFPVFDDTAGGGAGIYRVSGFLEALVTSAARDATGSSSTFVLTPQRYLTSGVCCLLNDFNKELKVCDTGTLQGGRNADAVANCRPRNLSNNPPPPPIPPCPSVTVTPPVSQRVLTAANKTLTPVTFSLTLSSSSLCVGLSYSLVRVNGQQTLSFDPPTRVGNVVTLVLPAGTTAQPNLYNLTVTQGNTIIPQTEQATLTVG